MREGRNLQKHKNTFFGNSREKKKTKIKKIKKNKSNNFRCSGKKLSFVKDFAINQLMFTHLTPPILWLNF
jgi:hypothetical protein